MRWRMVPVHIHYDPVHLRDRVFGGSYRIRLDMRQFAAHPRLHLRVLSDFVRIDVCI